MIGCIAARRGSVALALLLSFVSSAAAAAAPVRPRRPVRRALPPPPLVWHVETLDGVPVESHLGDEPINPASVVKVATSWWALQELGPDHRFETRFFARGTIDRAKQTLRGDLLVVGAGDPDFHAENAFLVAEAVNGLGIRRVTGSLIVDHRFWIGWENGSEGRVKDPDQRAAVMGGRLRAALDPQRWTRATRGTWYRFAARSGRRTVPRLAVAGGIVVDDGGRRADDLLLAIHRSNPLLFTLRRFNASSNNDIERVGDALGSPDALAEVLRRTLADDAGEIRLDTTSGLGENRLAPRQIVALLRELRKTTEAKQLGIGEVLPVSGCDSSTVTLSFPLFAHGENATSLIAKTGTLVSTDGGVTALAGFLGTANGELVFAVAAPANGGRRRASRAAEQRWLLDLASRFGGARPHGCMGPLPFSDTEASVVPANETALLTPTASR